jgi:hypothetical protein
MRRREFIALVSCFIATPQLSVAQPSDRKRQIGLLSPFSERDPETQARIAAFKQLLEKLGWTEGRNVLIDVRFSDGNPERTRGAAAGLVALAPDVLVAYANPAVSALKPLTQIIPIVFTQGRCVDCSGGCPSEVRNCKHNACSLWPLRLGHNPNRAGIGGSTEDIAIARQSLKLPEPHARGKRVELLRIHVDDLDVSVPKAARVG